MIADIEIDGLPDDPSILKQLIRDLIAALKTSELGRAELVEQISNLLSGASRRKPGANHPDQLLLGYIQSVLDEEDRPHDDTSTSGDGRQGKKNERSKGKPRSGHGRNPLPKLPVKETRHIELPKGSTCSCSAPSLHAFGQEKSYRIEYVPSSLHLIEIAREKCSCRRCGQVIVAEMPPEAIPKGIAGPGLLAHVITSKYCDHIPLHRQCQILRRSDVRISEKTMVDWVRRIADLCRPLVERMHTLLLESIKIHTDDTTVKTKQPGRERKHGTKRVHTGRIWVYVGGNDRPYTVFDFTDSRSREGPSRMLEGYEGYLQADAYGGYDALYGDGKIVEVACMAHARRYFEKAELTDPVRSSIAISYIRELYDIEDRVRGLGDAARKSARQEDAVSILARFKNWLEQESVAVLPQSPISKAIQYTLTQWEALERYTEHGALEPDNNIAENALRGLCLGRRNWLFFGSNEGGRRAAVLLSLISSAKRHGHDPFAYLRDLLTRLPADPTAIESFLPDRWTPPIDASAAPSDDVSPDPVEQLQAACN